MKAKSKMKKNVGPVTLGEEYIDYVHNRKGVATCYAIHLTGCNRVCLEWLDKEGMPRDMWVDETRLTTLKGELVIAPEEREKGPGGDPARRGIK